MKRQVSICFLLALVVIVLTLVYIKSNNETGRDRTEQNTKNTELTTEDNKQSITSSHEYTNYYFYVKNDNGRVSVYDVKTQTLYMETSIETNLLTEELQRQLEDGIYFKTEEELYDFLESYSS